MATPYAFFGHGPQVGPEVFLTDDLSAERNALEICWPRGICLLCTFHVLQAFWRWLYDSKHQINKEDRPLIMAKMKLILYTQSKMEMDKHYYEFKQSFYQCYPQLRKHFELLWERCFSWALSYRTELHIHGNNTNNYVERSFSILKDIVFAHTQAYNCVQVFQFVTTNIERFYVHRLLNFAHKHSGTYRVTKRFLCPGWESVDKDNIKKSNVENEYSVVSTRNDNLTYTVNIEIRICSCPVGINGAPCKHQGAVSAKFHITTLNFLPSLTSEDRMLYAYIALGYTAKDRSFYASLRAGFAQQEIVPRTEMEISANVQDRLETSANVLIRKSNESDEGNKGNIGNISSFTNFLEEIKDDYIKGGTQLCIALDKFADRYKVAKLKSIPRLVSFLYDLKHGLDPTSSRIKSGSMIRVQVESVKRRKTEGSGRKRKLPVSVKEKENLDPQIIPSRKKRKTSKKEHKLSRNVLKNQPN
ncbi:hypothetical protein RhiirA4_482542 [Rhizophagus irregularis]|uniref:SWIM-type domain-containing protein n=1 Tax=Rhizophagus irregularis TaxID=588596 RepID=A0A2I1HLC0_9GLOM|nr:hypothetical protein RhiirA4_482542 [Rhizophagus irregularis]